MNTHVITYPFFINLYILWRLHDTIATRIVEGINLPKTKRAATMDDAVIISKKATNRDLCRYNYRITTSNFIFNLF